MQQRRLAVWSCAAAVLMMALVAVGIRLPDPLFDDPLSSVLEARDGSLLGARIASDGQWRFAARDTVPAKFAAAVVAFEDKRFRWHPGFDPLALGRAAWANLQARKVVRRRQYDYDAGDPHGARLPAPHVRRETD